VVFIATCTDSFVRFEHRAAKYGGQVLFKPVIPTVDLPGLQLCRSSCLSQPFCAGFLWKENNINASVICILYDRAVGETEESPLYDLYVRETCQSVGETTPIGM